MGDCIICCDELKDAVTCLICKGVCCRPCFSRFLVEAKTLDVKCMFPRCNQIITYDFIVMNTTELFLQTEYKEYRSKQILILELAQMENTQPTIKAYLNAQMAIGRGGHEDDQARLCVAHFGCGWEDFDFGTGMGNKPNSEGKSTMHCPARNCLGFVYSFVCNICSCRICEICHEIEYSQTHRCDPNIIASVRSLKSETKQCPKCGVAIFKREGCDQMFCTQCHVTFSWETLKIHHGHVHNPHYFEWLYSKNNKNQNVPQLLQERKTGQCEQFITWKGLRSCFTPQDLELATKIRKRLPSISDIKQPLESIAHYYIAFENLRMKIVHIRATSGNHAYVQPIDNRDLRVQFALNEINESKYRSLLISRDTDYRKMICYCNVYFTVYQLTMNIFDNLYTFLRERHKITIAELRKMKPLAFFFQIYTQLLTVLQTGNDCLEHYDKVFGSDSRLCHFSLHPYTDLPKAAKQEI